jgi:hypothetical protein
MWEKPPTQHDAPRRVSCRPVKYISEALLSLAYILAVVDGTLQDKGSYPSEPGRTGLREYWRKHRCIVVGAVLGVAGALLGIL